MQALHQQLQQNLQLIYRKAIDADAAIDQLQEQGKGKFATIFDTSSGFETSAKRFSPYVQELAKRIESLHELPEHELSNALPPIVKQIELLFATLADFKATLKAG